MSRGRGCLNLLPPERKAAAARRRILRRTAAAGAVLALLLAGGTGWLMVEVRSLEEELRAAGWSARGGMGGGSGAGEEGRPGLGEEMRSLAAMRRRVAEAEAMLAAQRKRGPVPAMLARTDEAARAAAVRLLRVEAAADGRLVVDGRAPSLEGVASFVRWLREKGFRETELTFPADFTGGIEFQVVLRAGFRGG